MPKHNAKVTETDSGYTFPWKKVADFARARPVQKVGKELETAARYETGECSAGNCPVSFC